MRGLLFVLCAGSAVAAIPNAVKDEFVPSPYEQTRIGGLLGERMKINLEKRLLRVDEKALVEGFQTRPGKHPWIGEHIGKYLHAGCNTWRNTHDPRLKTQMDRMVRALIASQLPDGYLGTYTDDQRWTSWDVWVHKYNLIGLLSYYEHSSTGPPWMRLVRSATCSRGRSETHRGSVTSSRRAPTSAWRRQVCSSRWWICTGHTGDPQHLEFCRYILRAWDQPNGPKVVSSLLSTGSVYKTANAKGYEMMSDLVGVLELYRLTGERKLFDAAARAWDDIHANRLYITGTTSSHEHFQADAFLSGEENDDVGEGCATVTWLQLTWQLLRLTGDAKYAEQLERTVYNQLLAAQDPSNGNICYFTPMNGSKHATPGINCCVSSEPRGISMIPALSGGQRGSGMAVVLYAPGQIAGTAARIETTTDYPASGAITLTVRPDRASASFPVYLRVPQWTKSYTATAAGQTYQGKPGEWLTIERPWTDGDTIKVQMDMTVQVLDGSPTYNQSVAIQRGPQVLALEEELNPMVASMDTVGPADGATGFKNAVNKLSVTWIGKQAYSIPGARGKDLVLVPFADAKSYRIWLMKPDTRMSYLPIR